MIRIAWRSLTAHKLRTILTTLAILLGVYPRALLDYMTPSIERTVDNLTAWTQRHEQARAPGLLAVKRDELQPGDLVFFNTLKRTFSHVGIYVGEGKFIHAPKPGGEVRVEDMRFMYWAKRFTGARRAEQAQVQAAAAELGNLLTNSAATPSSTLSTH